MKQRFGFLTVLVVNISLIHEFELVFIHLFIEVVVHFLPYTHIPKSWDLSFSRKCCTLGLSALSLCPKPRNKTFYSLWKLWRPCPTPFTRFVKWSSPLEFPLNYWIITNCLLLLDFPLLNLFIINNDYFLGQHLFLRIHTQHFQSITHI